MKKQRWVIKAGSQMVCGGGPLLIRDWMLQVARLRKEFGVEVVWVTSGAIAMASERVGFKKKKRTLQEKQALSALGQPAVMELYNLALEAQGLMGAQILLTYDDLAHEKRHGNFVQTVEQLLDWNRVPILNENDAVATEEIRFGDNDSLSAKVAKAVGADRLVILTDVEGLFDKDPRSYKDAKLIPSLSGVPEKMLGSVGSQSLSGKGTGGMLSKLKAAQLATQNQIETFLVKGDIPQVLLNLVRGQEVGTRIKPSSKNGRVIGVRKRSKK